MWKSWDALLVEGVLRFAARVEGGFLNRVERG
jgi:hypothetical protein